MHLRDDVRAKLFAPSVLAEQSTSPLLIKLPKSSTDNQIPDDDNEGILVLRVILNILLQITAHRSLTIGHQSHGHSPE